MQRDDFWQSAFDDATQTPSFEPHLPSVAQAFEALHSSAVATHFPSFAAHCAPSLHTTESLQSASVPAVQRPPLAVQRPALAQGLSVQLSVPEKAEVPGDGSAVRLRVARTRLQASFSWRSVPKLYPVVFRVARLTNTAPFPLLPGAVDAFRQTGFLGRQPLERVAQGAPFELTFGIEEGLRVERQVVEEVKKDEGLFGGKKRFRYAYRFEVANYRKAPEEVELAEHIPVSELDDVKVELDGKKTTTGYALVPDDGSKSLHDIPSPGHDRFRTRARLVDVTSTLVAELLLL